MDSVESFVCEEYKIPVKYLEQLAKDQRLQSLYPSTVLDFSVVRSTVNANRSPSLVLFMHHGWTSNKIRMIEQTRLLISEMLQKKRYACHTIWFVQINAPYLIEQPNSISPKQNGYISNPFDDDFDDEDETLISTDDDDDAPRAWWEIDSLNFISQMFFGSNTEELFRDMGNGLEYSMEYCRQIVTLVQKQQPTCAIAFMGFSQGGGMALNCALGAIEYCHNLSGLYICSGLANNTINIDSLVQYITDTEDDKVLSRLATMPLFHSHGTKDPTVFWEFGLAFRAFLSRSGLGTKCNREYTFNGYHEINEQVRTELSKMCLKSIAYQRGMINEV